MTDGEDRAYFLNEYVFVLRDIVSLSCAIVSFDMDWLETNRIPLDEESRETSPTDASQEDIVDQPSTTRFPMVLTYLEYLLISSALNKVVLCCNCSCSASTSRLIFSSNHLNQQHFLFSRRFPFTHSFLVLRLCEWRRLRYWRRCADTSASKRERERERKSEDRWMQWLYDNE